MKQKSPAELREIKHKIEALFPETDPEVLKAQINWVFDQYNTESLISRDTHPNRRQMIQAVEGIQSHLESVMARFCEDDGAAIMGWLSGVMDDPKNEGIESSGTSFADKLTQLHKTTKTTLEELNAHDGEFEINGTPQKRRTRTSVRDELMIPMLTVIASRNGLSPADDWEDLDKACEFASLVMEYASIPVPDVGQGVAQRGEVAQGRLRRMIKGAARRYEETGQV